MIWRTTPPTFSSPGDRLCGYTVYETPPNSQGLILLEELNLIEGFDLAAMSPLTRRGAHDGRSEEAGVRTGIAAGDPAFIGFEPALLLTKEHAAMRRRTSIRRTRGVAWLLPAASADTTSFVVADGDETSARSSRAHLRRSAPPSASMA
jgi:gamma-glutamyltranspeptidase/glutathione hydrolase